MAKIIDFMDYKLKKEIEESPLTLEEKRQLKEELFYDDDDIDYEELMKELFEDWKY